MMIEQYDMILEHAKIKGSPRKDSLVTNEAHCVKFCVVYCPNEFTKVNECFYVCKGDEFHSVLAKLRNTRSLICWQIVSTFLL